MNPMDRIYGEGRADELRSFGPYGEYGAYGREYGEDFGGRSYGNGGYGAYARRSDEDSYRAPRFDGGSEHVWRGGVLGWLGSGVLAGAAWFGSWVEGWGGFVGRMLKGTTAEVGRAIRNRGGRIGSAIEHRGEDLTRGRYRASFGRPPRSYRRPDDRILDDVHQRIAMSGVDADEVEIEVSNGIVTLSGRVPRRFDKRVIEEVAEQVFGVDEIQNHLRLARRVDESATGAERRSQQQPGNGSRFNPGAGTPS